MTSRGGNIDPDRMKLALDGSAFCTGHTCFEGAAETLFYTESLERQFVDDYRQAHGLHKPKGPGRVELPDWSSKRRDSPWLPITGASDCARARELAPPTLPTRISSKTIGSWWTDPIFKQPQEELGEGAPAGAPAAAATRPDVPSDGEQSFMTCSSKDIGRFYAEKEIFGKLDPPVSKFNKTSAFGDESASSFALEDIPIADRML